MRYVLILLGWYLDLLLYLVLSAWMGSLFGLDGNLWVDIAVFLVIRGIAMLMTTTPGQWLVGPAVDERLSGFGPAPRQWANLLAGTLLFLEGTKRCVRWLEVDAPLPFMGFEPQDLLVQGAIGIATGMLSIAAGGALLRLAPMGRWLAFLTIAITAVSVGLSWKLWDEWIVRTVISRRAAQGLPVESGDIGLMQNMVPEGLAAALFICFVLLFLCRGRS